MSLEIYGDFDLTDALERSVVLKLLAADVAGYDRQLASISKQIAVLEAQAATITEFRIAAAEKLQSLEGKNAQG